MSLHGFHYHMFSEHTFLQLFKIFKVAQEFFGETLMDFATVLKNFKFPRLLHNS